MKLTAVIFAALVLACAGPAQQDPMVTQASAERNAKTYATSMGYQIHGAACSGADSDGDHYVSCNLNLGDGGTRVVLCGYDDVHDVGGRHNGGCKEQVQAAPVVVAQPVASGS